MEASAMEKCPICEKENTGLVCASCGFDSSRDYEAFPTLFLLPEGLPSRKAAQSHSPDLHCCESCGNQLFYLNSAKGVCICAKCGTEV